jgi:hypothetical protein
MGPNRALIGLGIALGAALVGCGDDEENGAGGADAAGSGSTGGADHAYVDLPMRSGTLTLFESHVEGIRQTNLIGAFLDISAGFPGACAEEAFGACTVTFCTSGSVSRDSLVDAGALTIASGDDPPRVTDRNAATGFYLATFVDDTLLTTGTDVVLSTQGSHVPAFQSTLRSPPLATVTSALPPEGGRLSTSLPLELTWTADDDDGELVIALRAIASRRNAAVECPFPIAAGAGQIPAEAIAAAATVIAPQSVVLEVETRTRATTTVDDYGISLALVITALAGDLDAIRTISGFDE